MLRKGKPIKDLQGKVFGSWKVIGPCELRPSGINHKVTFWLCRCKCGYEKFVCAHSLLSGTSTQCLKCRSNKPLGEAARKWVLHGYKRKAVERNLSWSLLDKEFHAITQLCCHYCGCPPSNCCRRPEMNGGYIYSGVDRDDNSKGYFTENVVPCCSVCNHAKYTMSSEAFVTWALRVAEYQKLKQIASS